MAIPVATAVFHFISFLLLMHTLQTFQLLVAADILPTIQRRLSDDPSAGFINIDCGLAEPGPVYNPETGLYYTSDEKYISTGINYNISAANHSYSSLFSTLRSFPEGRRNCYSLSPLKPNHTYLIRAQFLYGNYDGMNSIPAFDVYIGVNLWFNLTDDTYYKEIIHVATTNSIHVCLVNTGHGTPYINSLELRPLDINSPYPASPASSLSTWYHNDFGGLAPDTANYHLKDDVYDRLWYRSPTWSGCKVVSATNVTFDASQGNPCKVPISVLMNACEQNDGGTNWTLGRSSISAPTSEFYFYWHFAELELLGSNDTREFNIFLPYGSVRKFGPITPKYLQVTTIASPKIYLSESTSLIYTLEKTNESNRYPILNAVELYMVLELPASPTNPEDVDAVTAIKDQYVIPKIWQGDPCLPIDYQWDGLNCSYDDNNPPRITSLSLNSKIIRSLNSSNLTGEIPPSLSKLTSLKYLNLSNNGLTGKIPEFLANLPLLNIIDLTANNLMGPVPPLLAEKAHNKSMDLRLQWNPDVCKSYPCEVIQVNKKRHHFIIPVVTSTVALVSLLAVICIIFLAFKWRKKPGFLAMWWRRGEKERDTNAIGSTDGLLEGAIQPKNKRFNSSKIAQITDNFRKVLGKGGFGKVYYGVLEDGTEVAVKVLNNTLSTITLMKQFCAEAEPLMRIHHVNLVTLIGYCDELANMALVYEYMSCGDLHSKILEKNENPLSWPARLQISVDAAQGLKYLHSDCRPPIIHRDIKPENILLDETGHAKIADFGISRFFTTDSQGAAAWTDFAGTRGYLDPECYHPINPLSEKSDVYAFGIVLLQLLTGQPALIKNTNHEDEGDVNVIDEIVDWVLPKVESGDILAIIDKRLQGDSINVDSAWKFLEIALECVKRTGNERPRMSKVVADLEACYALVEYREQNSSQGLGTSFVSTLPIPR